MNESILKISRSPKKDKKYVASVKNHKTGRVRSIHFGHSSYEHYKDSTKLKAWKSKDHGDTRRRRLYFQRFSGVPNKMRALSIEKKKSKGLYNAKILSHKYLW